MTIATTKNYEVVENGVGKSGVRFLKVRLRRHNVLTKSEIRILQFYRAFRSERFCCSIRTIAQTCKVGTRTVQRANERFQEMGILAWVPGNSASWRKNSRGQANKYRLVMSGIEGSAVAPSLTRRLYRLTQGKPPSKPNRPNRPSFLIS